MSDTLPTELSSCWHVAPQRVTTLTLDEIRRDIDWSSEIVSGASPSVSAPTHAEPQPTDEPVVVPQAERLPASAPETPATPTTAHAVTPTSSLEPSSPVATQPKSPTVETPNESLPEDGSEREAELAGEKDTQELTQERLKTDPAPDVELAPRSPNLSEPTHATPEPLAATIDEEGDSTDSIEDQQIALTAESEEDRATNMTQDPAAEPPKPTTVETVSAETETVSSVKGPIPPGGESDRTSEQRPPQAEATSTEATATHTTPTINATSVAETTVAATTVAATTVNGTDTRDSADTEGTQAKSHEASPEPQVTAKQHPPVSARGPDSPSLEKPNSRGAPSCPPRSEEVPTPSVTHQRVPHSSHDRDRSLPLRSISKVEETSELTLMSIRARTFEPDDYDSLLGYVEQLENVIYQLNVEMGRLRSDSPAGTNERELLARRLVELSLENSELKQATQSNPIPYGEDPS